MIDPAGRLQHPASAERIFSGGEKDVRLKSQSFGAELSDQLASTRNRAPLGPSSPTQLPARQETVTWRQDPDAPSSSTSGSTPTQPSGLQGLVVNFPSAIYGSTSKATETGSASQAPATFDDIYWAKQPAAVQQLRNIQDPAQRTAAAEQLAQQGYTIDAPIMVWGWDPQITTAARQAMGYTWVPSALQQPVEVAPGLTFDGQSYDPSNPPAGSIAV